MEPSTLIPHLFRTESGRITAVLCRHFGIALMDMAEDIASETFLAALETWPYKGIPENPVAWLYTVAKNKARNYLQRQQLFNGKITRDLQHAAETCVETDIDLSEQNITDSQLQLLFAICHPALAPEVQITLALRILCGFGIEEIAHAFLTSKETVNKRLFRAKDSLRRQGAVIGFPPEATLGQRLEAVLTTIYLLYNEGYYSECHEAVLREDLCREAMRLARLLSAYEATNTPSLQALSALMCFHSSRFPARRGDNGAFILYGDQDETLWDQALISEGAWHLHQASQGDRISAYHLEAAIAYWHTVKEDGPEKWTHILQLYNQLLQLHYTPVAALNRTFALSKVKGNQVAIAEAEKLQLNRNPYYHMLLGELYAGTDPAKAQAHWQQALSLARTESDRQHIREKLAYR